MTDASPIHPPVPAATPPRVAARATSGERIAAAIIALCILAVLVTAASLTPSQSGLGTHKQMGLSECSWIAMMGKPCPTCGMTTAFASAANLSPVASIRAQPFAAMSTLTAAAIFWGAVHVALFGSRLGHTAARAFLQPRILWPVGTAWAASWVYKVFTMPATV